MFLLYAGQSFFKNTTKIGFSRTKGKQASVLDTASDSHFVAVPVTLAQNSKGVHSFKKVGDQSSNYHTTVGNSFIVMEVCYMLPPLSLNFGITRYSEITFKTKVCIITLFQFLSLFISPLLLESKLKQLCSESY